MIIYYSNTSPFARRVSMFAKITKTTGIQWKKVNPLDSNELRTVNPLGKVPALVDGEVRLVESSVICDYLDDLFIARGGHSLLHKGEADYVQLQRANALANGITEASLAMVMERRRTDAEQSQFWLARWQLAINLGLQEVDLDHCGTLESPNIATITLSAALGYLDFRLPDLEWRKQNPRLKSWLEVITSTDWYRETIPEIDL